MRCDLQAHAHARAIHGAPGDSAHGRGEERELSSVQLLSETAGEETLKRLGHNLAPRDSPIKGSTSVRVGTPTSVRVGTLFSGCIDTGGPCVVAV